MSDDGNPSAMFVRWPYNTFFYALAATGPLLSLCSETSPTVPSPSYEFTTGMRRFDPSLSSPTLAYVLSDPAHLPRHPPQVVGDGRLVPCFRYIICHSGFISMSYEQAAKIEHARPRLPSSGTYATGIKASTTLWAAAPLALPRTLSDTGTSRHSIEMTGNEIIVRTISLLDDYPPLSFLNSRPYDNGAVTLYDITVGSNLGCNTVDTPPFVGSCYGARTPNLYQLLDVLCFVIGT
ncbi:hypothetical protein H4582DRAFT_2083865 [Lactarius indigo]|nr:hypothetical protein H4582DRAFT_2083865 [Lactarius indigo]